MKLKEEKQAATNDSLYYQQRMQENAVAYQNLEYGIASLERRIDEESTNSRVLLETEKVKKNEIDSELRNVKSDALSIRYAADMLQAQSAWKESNIWAVDKLLAKYTQSPGFDHIRGWEWNLLHHRLHSAKLIFRLVPDHEVQKNTGYRNCSLARSKTFSYCAASKRLEDVEFGGWQTLTSYPSASG